MKGENVILIILAALFSFCVISFCVIFSLFFSIVKMVMWNVASPTEMLCIDDGGKYIGNFGRVSKEFIDPFEKEYQLTCDSPVYNYKRGVCEFKESYYVLKLKYLGHLWEEVNKTILCEWESD